MASLPRSTGRQFSSLDLRPSCPRIKTTETATTTTTTTTTTTHDVCQLLKHNISDLLRNGNIHVANATSKVKNGTHQDAQGVILPHKLSTQTPATVINQPSTGNNINNNNNADLIIDVVIIFMTGLAIIAGLVVVVYISAIMYDRYCGCYGQMLVNDGSDDNASPTIDERGDNNNNNNNESQNNTPSAEVYGPVAFKARLWGLTLEERKAVLEQVFANHSINFTTNAMKKSKIQRWPSEDVAQQQEATLSPSLQMPSLSVDSSLPKNSQGHSDLEEGRDANIPCDFSVQEDEWIVQKIPQRMAGQMQEYQSSPFEYNKDSSIKTTVTEEAEETDSSHSSSDLDDNRLSTLCAICLSDYDEGDRILCSICCTHMYHYDCLMPWMEKNHDHCPYCRLLLYTPSLMRRAAVEALGKPRVRELSCRRSQIETSSQGTTSLTAVQHGTQQSRRLGVGQ